MVLSDENKPALVKSTSFPERAFGRKFGQEIRQNRRVLSVLNQNLVAAQAYPYVVSKRGLLEKHAISDKNGPDAASHRPITRKFAAETVSAQQCPPPEVSTRKSNAGLLDIKGYGDCIFVDAKDDFEAIDEPVPMFLEQTEGTLIETMEEVEMEDIDEEPVIDIDDNDAKDPLAVIEYVQALYLNYRKMESFSCVLPNYMVQQSDINEKMRAILVDWIIEVHNKFDLLHETLFLTINLIDRFLSREAIPRKKLQLVGLVAMLLACKYEEVSVPVVEDLILISDNAYTRKEVLEMERLMLNKLQFNMSVPTPYVFIKRFLKAAQSDNKLEQLAFFLMELCLVEYEMLKFPPSLLAAASVYTAQCSLYRSKQWTKTCEWHSSYSEDHLSECSKLIVALHQNSRTGKLTGAYRKYCTSKFNYSAKFEPAHVLLETQP